MEYQITIKYKKKISSIIIDAKSHEQAIELSQKCTKYRGAEIVNIQPVVYA